MATRIGRGRDWSPRKVVPDEYRNRGGAHLVRTRFEPEVCGNCGGKGHVYDVRNSGDSPVMCPVCEGSGVL